MRLRRIIEQSGNLLVILATGVLLAGIHAPAQQPEAVGQEVRLTGVVTDSMCGAKHMMTGDDAKCARTCVKGGNHYALLVGRDVHTLVGHAEELDKLAGKAVTVSGTLANDGAVRLSSVQPDTVPGSTKSTPSQGADNSTSSSQSKTIEGLVRDIACPIQNEAASARTFNLKCALECVRAGSPIVIQTDDGTLYMPISASMPDEDMRPKLTPFVGKYVRVQGEVFERKGTRAVVVREIKELRVSLVTDAQ